MEQHAVPRNITGFQFRLVGDMTLKQFAYLASGALIAYLIFKIAPFPQIINIAIAGFVFLTGVAFAFLPIQERPLDRWLLAFAKSITSPTQFVWRKNNPPPDILIKPLPIHKTTTQNDHLQTRDREAKEKLKAYLASLPTTPHETLNIQEKKAIEQTMALFGVSKVVTTPITSAYQTKNATPPLPKIQSPPVTHAPITHTPISPSPTQKPPQVNQPTAINNKPVADYPPVSAQTIHSSTPLSSTTVDLNYLQKQIAQLANEKQNLQKELLGLKQMLIELQQKQVPLSKNVKPSQVKETKEPTVKMVTPNTASQIGITKMPEAANIILGVIQDTQKRLLPNIIITIKNKEGIPLRAIKTNKLGQFETATPLPNGTYLLEIEDPLRRYIFDVVEITLSGKILLPIEIIAKGEKEIMREKLTKELFGSN